MGADLLVSCVEIEKDKEPDWESADTHIAAITEEEAKEIIAGRMGVLLEDLDEIEEGPYLKKVQDSYATVKDAWQGGCYRRFVKLYLSRTIVFLAGDTSWGDAVQEVEDMSIFAESGAAAAAGFIVEGEQSNVMTLVLKMPQEGT